MKINFFVKASCLPVLEAANIRFQNTQVFQDTKELLAEILKTKDVTQGFASLPTKVRTIIIDDDGIEAFIMFNRNNMIRAAVVNDLLSARLCVEHNDANVIIIPLKIIAPECARAMVESVVNASCHTRHLRRVEMLGKLSEDTLLTTHTELLAEIEANVKNCIAQDSHEGKVLIMANDHAALQFKIHLKNYLAQQEIQGLQILDLGSHSSESVDYPLYGEYAAWAQRACGAAGLNVGTILLCGSGIGISIAGNRYETVRAALCSNMLILREALKTHKINTLGLGARVLGVSLAEELALYFLRHL